MNSDELWHAMNSGDLRSVAKIASEWDATPRPGGVPVESAADPTLPGGSAAALPADDDECYECGDIIPGGALHGLCTHCRLQQDGFGI
ncbi:MAG: hypothetical protein ACYCU7_19335 [Acidimicrobiales bacterium]